MTIKLSKTYNYQYTNDDGIEVEMSLRYHVPVPSNIEDRSQEFADMQFGLCKDALISAGVSSAHLIELMRSDMHFMVDSCNSFDPKKHDVYRVGEK